MTGSWQDTLLILLVIALAAWSIYHSIRTGAIKQLDLPTVVRTAEAFVPLGTELRDISQMVVFEIEQYRRDPNHNISNDDAFKMAFDRIHNWFPAQTEGLTPEKINTAIHAAVLLASQATHTIEASKTQDLGSFLSGGTQIS